MKTDHRVKPENVIRTTDQAKQKAPTSVDAGALGQTIVKRVRAVGNRKLTHDFAVPIPWVGLSNCHLGWSISDRVTLVPITSDQVRRPV
jgi:hypothetical protein